MLQILLDMSRAASMTDMRPNRGAMMIQILQTFVREFFDQNPLSHLSIMLMRNGRAERLTELSGSPVRIFVPRIHCSACYVVCAEKLVSVHAASIKGI